MCVAPEEPDKGKLWEAETEALDNGKAYLIDPQRNSEHATWARYIKKEGTHSGRNPLLLKVTSCDDAAAIGNNRIGQQVHPFLTD